MQMPGFKQKIAEGWYQVRVAGQDVSPDEVTAKLHEPLPDGAVIHIVPRTEGGKSGWSRVFAGAALVAASFIPGLNAAVWAGAAATWGSIAFSVGASLMLGGLAQVLAPKPGSPGFSHADNGKQNTYFSSLDNMIAQGNPVPVPYGEIMVGSRRISQMLATRDESSPEKVVSFGSALATALVRATTGVSGPEGIRKPRVIVR